MKKKFSYICLALCCSLLMTSCINEYFDVEQDSAMVELRIAMPSVQSAPDTPPSKAVLDEAGNSYENSIVDINDIHIFLFDNKGNYLGKAFNLQLLGADDATTRLVKGNLPNKTLGMKDVTLVFMANYGSRGPVPAEPKPGTTLADWRKSMTFDYGKTAWSADDAATAAETKRYIPMSGEVVFTIKERADLMNYASIDLTRAIAKVRVRVKNACKFSITSLQVFNASSKSFSLKQQGKFAVPENPGQGLYAPLQFNGKIKANEFIEFYIPEQDVPNQNAKYRTELKIGMTKDGQTTIETIEFKNYAGPNVGKYFAVKRNNIYEFVVNKKDEFSTDISVGVQRWIVDEINTDFE